MHVFQTLHVIQVTFKACACITVRLTVAQSSSAGGSNDVGKMFLHWLHYVNLRYNNKVCQGSRIWTETLSPSALTPPPPHKCRSDIKYDIIYAPPL